MSRALTVRPIDASEYDIGIVVATRSEPDVELGPPHRRGVPHGRSCEGPREHAGWRHGSGGRRRAAAALRDVDARTVDEVRADVAKVLDGFAGQVPAAARHSCSSRRPNRRRLTSRRS
jgi:hypothetical protein